MCLARLESAYEDLEPHDSLLSILLRRNTCCVERYRQCDTECTPVQRGCRSAPPTAAPFPTGCSWFRAVRIPVRPGLFASQKCTRCVARGWLTLNSPERFWKTGGRNRGNRGNLETWETWGQTGRFPISGANSSQPASPFN